MRVRELLLRPPIPEDLDAVDAACADPQIPRFIPLLFTTGHLRVRLRLRSRTGGAFQTASSAEVRPMHVRLPFPRVALAVKPRTYVGEQRQPLSVR
jgi:hypothetical protein